MDKESAVRHKIDTMIRRAMIGGEYVNGQNDGFISVMVRKGIPSVQKDIPAVFEAYALLSYFLGVLPCQATMLNSTQVLANLQPTIHHDMINGRLVVLIPISPGELGYVAHWLTDHLRSHHVKNMPGTLALAFSMEHHQEIAWLLPEWFSAFYIQGKTEHCIPILSLPSVLTDQRLGEDWVSMALERMTIFSLPQKQAVTAIYEDQALNVGK